MWTDQASFYRLNMQIFLSKFNRFDLVLSVFFFKRHELLHYPSTPGSCSRVPGWKLLDKKLNTI